MKKFWILILILATPLLLYGIYYWNWYSTDNTIKVANTIRRYRLHVPLSGSAGKPLLVLLHGYGDHPRLTEMYTGMSRLADEKGFSVVYPYGTNSEMDISMSWNAGSCCAIALINQVDDMTFIDTLTNKLADDLKVDKKRVYLAGFSNGALLVHRIAAERPGIFSGFGTVAGTIGGQSFGSDGEYIMTETIRPVPMVMFHGLTDPAIPYLGGQGKLKGTIPTPMRVVPFSVTKEFWREQNGCQGWDSQTDMEGVIREEGQNCLARTMAVTVPDRGHVWLGGLLEFMIYGQDKNINTSREMWRFLNEY